MGQQDLRNDHPGLWTAGACEPRRVSVDRLFFTLGSLSAFLAVAFGAFGAHALKARLSQEMLSVFEVGARYHFYHALALLAVAWAATRWPGGAVIAAGGGFPAGGGGLFCGPSL